ncbi:MAG TPA: hypothetical protein VM120_18080 [Bryobacteraceae bacterium]|nr:hypothetical protein [Bryobacteraceae bacterium]
MACKPYLNASGDLLAYFSDPIMERGMESAVKQGKNAPHLNLPPQKVREVLDKLSKAPGALEGPASS